MFADEKGYLVTEMVWEEVTDDEAETPSKTTTTAAAATAKSSATQKAKDEKPKVASKKTPAPAASGVGQKSMMSFFSTAKK